MKITIYFILGIITLIVMLSYQKRILNERMKNKEFKNEWEEEMKWKSGADYFVEFVLLLFVPLFWPIFITIGSLILSNTLRDLRRYGKSDSPPLDFY